MAWQHTHAHRADQHVPKAPRATTNGMACDDTTVESKRPFSRTRKPRLWCTASRREALTILSIRSKTTAGRALDAISASTDRQRRSAARALRVTNNSKGGASTSPASRQ